MRRIAAILAVAGGLFFVSWAGVAEEPGEANPSAVTEAIHERVQLVRAGKPLVIHGDPIASRQILPRFYERRGFKAAWRMGVLEQLQRAIEHSFDEGLNPDDYHRRALSEVARKVRSGVAGDDLLAESDILATDALIRLAYNLYFGKADPEALDPDWNSVRVIAGKDPISFIELAVASENLSVSLSELSPQQPIYQNLKAALARYRGIAAQGEWPRVPDGPTLKPGMKNERVAILRRRLTTTGDLGEEVRADAQVFDDAVQTAVKTFQRRQFLNPDGEVGPATLRALQVPVGRRIDQLRVNLERARWVLHDVPASFVLVDVAGFEVIVLRDGEPIWQSRVQVGKPYRRTPIFRAEITYLVLNPTWTVPSGILSNDILPAVRRNPAYLAEKNLRVIDHQGREVDPRGIDWGRESEKNFPYLLRQDPGPNNALGRVKFVFPNKHDVYLHDTPSKELFERDVRAFSSGCIRVERPVELAELLLNDPGNWSREKIQAAMDGKQPRTVKLESPVPVLLYYWTAQGQPDGTAQFKADIYGRDDAVLKVIDGEFKFRKQPLTRDLGY
jgi:murein L,D-transpeptidase YcbB/YkuD